MKKLKLDLDDLEVESFSTTPESADAGEGTVFGYSIITEGNTCQADCTNDCTFVQTCGCTNSTCGCTDTCDCTNSTCGCTDTCDCTSATCDIGCGLTDTCTRIGELCICP